MNVQYNQPNPKSEVQISIGKSFSAAFKEASFVAIQLPRCPPITGGLTVKDTLVVASVQSVLVCPLQNTVPYVIT